MHYLGAHVSADGGVDKAVARAVALGANAFAFFTRNQRRWRAKPLDDATVAAFRDACAQHGFAPAQVLPHAGYLINLGHPEREWLTRSRTACLDELQRCERLGLDRLNIHPGNGLGQLGERACLARIATSINYLLERTEGVTLVLENTAGQGTSLGHRFEQLAEILAGIEDAGRVGVCLDTCHAFAAGYDLRSAEAVAATLSALADTIGLSRLRGLHLNDARRALGSRVDRHASLGEGEIGRTAFRALMRDPRLEGLPMILETPDADRWAEEIAWLRRQPRA